MHAVRECDRFNIAQSNSLKSQEQNTYSTYDGTVVFYKLHCPVNKMVK